MSSGWPAVTIVPVEAWVPALLAVMHLYAAGLAVVASAAAAAAAVLATATAAVDGAPLS